MFFFPPSQGVTLTRPRKILKRIFQPETSGSERNFPPIGLISKLTLVLSVSLIRGTHNRRCVNHQAKDEAPVGQLDGTLHCWPRSRPRGARRDPSPAFSASLKPQLHSVQPTACTCLICTITRPQAAQQLQGSVKCTASGLCVSDHTVNFKQSSPSPSHAPFHVRPTLFSDLPLPSRLSPLYLKFTFLPQLVITDLAFCIRPIPLSPCSDSLNPFHIGELQYLRSCQAFAIARFSSSIHSPL